MADCMHLGKELSLVGVDQLDEGAFAVNLQCECGQITARDAECELVVRDGEVIGVRIKCEPAEFKILALEVDEKPKPNAWDE